MQQRGELNSFRLFSIGIVALSLFLAMIGRALYLQVMNTQTFRTEAAANQIRIVYIPAPRGRILDRNGQILVDNETVQAITVQRLAVQEHPDLLGRLAALVGISTDEMNKRINDARYSLYRPVPIATDVTTDMVTYLREHQDEFPTVAATEIARRTYPNGTLAAHLLGYVGEINDKELKANKKNGYRLGDEIGKSGVEQSYETWLRGKPGIQKLEVNSSGRVLGLLGETAPTPGQDLRLTIDLNLQRTVEQSLQQALGAVQGTFDKSTGRHFAAPAGSAVVLDPNDGSVLAMASYPTYDPEQFINGISNQTFANLQNPANHFPLNNRVIQGQYAAGSTFKLVTSTAALQKGLITPQTSVNDTGSIQIGNRRFQNANKTKHGTVDLIHAIAVSSDVYFYKIGADFWFQKSKFGEAIQDEAKAYGFDKKTGVDLGGELTGRIPTPETRKQEHQANPKAFPEGGWFAGDNVNLAIGQGETAVTPLQLANAYAAFANGGTLYAPHVGGEIVTDLGKIVHKFTAKTNGHVDISEGNRNAMLTGFRGVTSFHGGTATAAFSGFNQSNFPIAGKTGTAQVNNKEDTALFVAFGPATQPQFVVAVVLEQAGYGGVASAPVARRVFEEVSGNQLSNIALGGSAD
jgi:penicillin-binding protein 2